VNPKQIKITEQQRLKISWDNGEESEISLKYLRDECPCANCKGETILFKTMRPARIKFDTPGKYEWKDGHDTGIYSWEYLKTLADDEASGTKHNYKPLV
jgi:DUF971 family protein